MGLLQLGGQQDPAAAQAGGMAGHPDINPPARAQHADVQYTEMLTRHPCQEHSSAFR